MTSMAWQQGHAVAPPKMIGGPSSPSFLYAIFLPSHQLLRATCPDNDAANIPTTMSTMPRALPSNVLLPRNSVRVTLSLSLHPHFTPLLVFFPFPFSVHYYSFTVLRSHTPHHPRGSFCQSNSFQITLTHTITHQFPWTGFRKASSFLPRNQRKKGSLLCHSSLLSPSISVSTPPTQWPSRNPSTLFSSFFLFHSHLFNPSSRKPLFISLRLFFALLSLKQTHRYMT